MQRPRGRPKAEVQLRQITVLLDPEFGSRIERARSRRQKSLPGVHFSISDVVRALLDAALTSEEQAGVQAELPFAHPMEARPKPGAELRPFTVLYHPAFVARLEAARERRRASLNGVKFNLSDTMRALLDKALIAEEAPPPVQTELAFNQSPELKTKKS